MASSQVPVHVTSLDKADGVYKKHAGEVLLGVSACGHMTSLSRVNNAPIPACCLQVPSGGPERMRRFPALVPQDLGLQGRGYLEAAADITLSSAGISGPSGPPPVPPESRDRRGLTSVLSLQVGWR